VDGAGTLVGMRGIEGAIGEESVGVRGEAC
jgi:hypothetical protein